MIIYTITFSNTTNVGASLQEYALYKYLCDMGHDVMVVDYLPDKLKNGISFTHRFRDAHSLNDFCRAILITPIDMLKQYKFWRFSFNMKKTRRCYSSYDIQNLPQPDLFICGSDQIWNPDIVGYDKGFFLQFPSTAKKAAYSASIGKNTLSEQETQSLLSLTNDLEHISVREKEILSIMPELKGRGAIHTLDPVFLLSAKCYEKIAVKPSVNNYILVYETEMNKQCGDVAKTIANKFSMKTIQMERVNNRYQLDKVIPYVSPAEFVGLVEHAKYIVTNSFHGIALSIIFKKEFYYIPLVEKKSRVDNLLEIGCLRNRAINSIDDISYKPIDYKNVTANFDKLLQQSKEYLDYIIRT